VSKKYSFRTGKKRVLKCNKHGAFSVHISRGFWTGATTNYLERLNVPEAKTKIMNEFRINEEMELFIRAKKHQPELFAQLQPAQKMQLGIYEGEKARAVNTGLTSEEVLRLRGLKLSIASDNLSPQERTTLALKISELENK
jgi:hypothetical protein